MSSGLGPLGRGDTVTLRVRAVGLYPEVPILQLWGLLGERKADYAGLYREIQAAAGPRLAARPEPSGPGVSGTRLCPGELALVEVLGVWYRCCVVSCSAQGYRVFLLDEGYVVATSAYYLAQGCSELFQLPPEVLGCVVADVMPSHGHEGTACGDSPVSKWTVEAMEFLSFLHGKEVSGVVQEVMMPQLIVLELPQLVAQMRQLGLAKRVSPSWFCQVLRRCLPFGQLKKQFFPQLLHVLLSYQPLSPALDYYYPQLQLGVTEPVIVTHVSDPHHIYCQLQCLSQEISCLSDTMCHAYDRWEQDLLPKVGSPCAARGMDGHWYRAILLELIAGEQDQHAALVIFVDYGRKETVTRANLRHLPAECFRMPVVTYVCALQGVSDGGCGWSPLQIDLLKTLVLGRGVSAHVKAFNSFEHLYYVTLYGENGVDLNHLFGSQACCLVSSRVSQTEAHEQLEVEKSITEELELTAGVPPVLIHGDLSAAAVAGVHLKTCTFYSAQVSYVQDPSEFWLQLHEHYQLFRQLRQCMWNFYSHSTKLDDPGSESLFSQDYEGKENLPTSLRQNYVEIKPGSSWGGHLEVGSTVNVILSYVENPSCFWCQLSRNCHDLEVLMDEIQEHCKNASQPHVWPNLVCLAQYSEDKKWYRALIVSEGVCAEKVEVIYVDYGNREQVCLTKLRAINEHFLRLEAQAFRCSLYNLIQPNGQNPFAWDEEAMQAFRQFVVDSSSDRDLKCTIFALASINRDLFNIVDLITPFQSACQFLTERGVARPLFPQKHMESLVQLHSYYYSSHGIKIGSEEDVYVTHVENPWTFYCQLERCADTLAQLADSISRLSERVTSTGTSGKSGNLCLARYSDSQWYRGVIMERQPKTKVFFVDFGNTETIETDDLLLVPNDASDILLVPMQAIRCSVSDLSSVSKEAATWFKEAVLERRLKAIVVAKDSDNTLLVELFDRNTQINTKLKELSLNSTGLCSYVHNETSCSRNADVNESIKTAESPLNACRPLENKKNYLPEAQREQGSKKHFKEEIVNLFQHSRKGDVAAGLLESDEMLSIKKDAILLNKAGEESLLFSRVDTLSYTKSDVEGRCVMLKNASDLPPQKIVPALKTLVYVSYVNDPQDFYVQLGSDEVQLNNILESLNNGKSVKDPCGQLFQVGDLISAVYSEDSRWYRAVVKEKTSHNLIRVHYIDYGDTSVISVDQARRLPKDLSSIPAMSIHCFLGGVKCKNNADWTEKAVFYFTKRTSEILLSCEFVKKVEDKWEVILSDHQGIITMDLVDKDIASRERLFSRKRIDKRENRDMITVCDPLPPQVQNEICVSDCKSFIWIFPEVGQTLKIYVTVVSGPGCFWCHRADTKDISNIEKKIEEAEKLGLSSLNNGKSHIKNGDACLAKYSQDGWFYRAQVRSVKDDSVVVRHVDYGSEETVSLEKIRQMPCELLRVPGQAFACCLSGFSPSEGSWLSEANKKFYDLTENLVLEAEVVEIRENNESEVPLCVVKLEASGNSINEEMKPFWKANKETGGSAFSNLSNPLKENRSSNSNLGLSLNQETTLKAELTGSAPKTSLCLGKEPQRLPVLQAQPSASNGTGTLGVLDPLEMHLPCDDLNELLQELEGLLEKSSGEGTKEAQETTSLEMQAMSGSEARETVLEKELLELPVVREETGQLAALNCLKILPLLNEKENLVPSVSDREKSAELIPSDDEPSFGEKTEKLQANLSGVHEAEVLRDDWMEADSPSVRPSSAHHDYPCNLKGFAVGSKCVVWTSLKWCDARILEVSEKGTKVLNLCSGNEEIVHPENVWNGIPDRDCRSSEVWQCDTGLGRTVLGFTNGDN
uniref:Tudor domain containing 6 n=1 Tax=Malurus cyaneus samueli TaxID=2593467 RepID=A0A8C5T8R7_9PASS